VPEGAFEVLIRQQIARLLEPSLDCAYEVYEELRKIVINIQMPELTRYYRLQSKICDVMESVLDKCLTPTTEMIANLIEIENAHINTNHPDFVGSADSLLNLFSNEQDQDNSNEDKAQPRKSQSHSLLGGSGQEERRGGKGRESGERFPDIAEVIDDPADAQRERVDKDKEVGGTQGSVGYLSSVFGGYLGGGKGKTKDGSRKEEEKQGGLEGDSDDSQMLSRAQSRR